MSHSSSQVRAGSMVMDISSMSSKDPGSVSAALPWRVYCSALRWKQGHYRNGVLDFKTQVSRPSIWETRRAKAAIAAGKVHHLVVRKLALARHDFWVALADTVDERGRILARANGGEPPPSNEASNFGQGQSWLRSNKANSHVCCARVKACVR